MKFFSLFVLTLFAIDAFPQRKVSGTITDAEGIEMPGVNIHENGNILHPSVSDIDGKFSIITTGDSCLLSFWFVGFISEKVIITQDTTVNIVLTEDCLGCCGCKRWLSIGTKYDIVNTTLGLSVSNGYDEMPLIHFEDFPSKLVYKVNAQTNFRRDYSFAAHLAWLNMPYPLNQWIIPSIGYEQLNYPSKDFFHRDIHLSVTTNAKLIRGALVLKTGYQKLDDSNNWGASIGLRKNIISRLYSGISFGYYFDYQTYSLYLQGCGKRISYRLAYDRIGEYDFFNLRLNLLFRI